MAGGSLRPFSPTSPVLSTRLQELRKGESPLPLLSTKRRQSRRIWGSVTRNNALKVCKCSLSRQCHLRLATAPRPRLTHPSEEFQRHGARAICRQKTGNIWRDLIDHPSSVFQECDPQLRKLSQFVHRRRRARRFSVALVRKRHCCRTDRLRNQRRPHQRC